MTRALKAAFDRVLKELESRPKDPRLLQRAGEPCQKRGDQREAATYFARVAGTYAEDGFFLKAVALLKQVLKLYPSLVSAHELMADCYTRLGLKDEAIQEHLQLLGLYRAIGATDAVAASLQALSQLGFRGEAGDTEF